MNAPERLYPAYNADSLANIERAKRKGNEAHMKKQYSTAITEYTKGLSYITMNGAPMAEPVSDPGKLMAQLYSNRSACYLLDGKYDKALADGKEAAKHLRWYKPWFRQGEAWLALNEYEKAIEAFDEAMKLVGPAAANEPAENVRRGRVAQIQKRLTKAKIKMEDRSLGLCLHQLSPGCGDICSSHSFSPVRNLVYSYARKMGNYIYLIENIASKECLLVDACWDIDGILAYAKHKKLKIVGAVVTHYHIDHVGGIPPPPFDIPGVRVDGLAKLLKKLPDASAYVNPADIPGIVKANPEISVDRFISTEDYGTMCLPMSLNGGTKSKPTSQQSGGRTTALQFIHTPGHTPGSQCILVNGNRLLSGDTLFIRSCGRVDFPDSDVMHMYHSLQLKLATLPDDVCIFPGHDYNGEMGLIGDEKREGLLKPLDRETFRKAMADTSADE